MADKQAIEALSFEERVFPPSDEFVAQANAGPEIYEEAEKDWLGFWQKQALERITWFKEPTQVLDDSNAPFFTWFADGQLNISYNCLDRHLETGGDKIAYYWEGETGDTREITFRELYEEVCQFANALADMGVEKGDRVAIYLGMIPELPIAMLACARLGAPHSVVFGGFSAESLRDRIEDAAATALFVAGVAQWQPVAKAMGIRHVLLIDPEGVAHLTPAMAERIRFDDQAPPVQRIAEGF